MADSFSTNLNLTKPEVGASTDTWGQKINTQVIDPIDAIFSATGTEVNVRFNSANFDDNKKAIFGTGDDLEIYHDGSNSVIKDAGTGSLNVLANIFDVRKADNSGSIASFNDNGSVAITGNVDVTGNITVSGTVDGVDIASRDAVLTSTTTAATNANTLATTANTTANAALPKAGGSMTGLLTADSGVAIDDITIDGTEIDLSSGDLTLDVAGQINLDADGGFWNFNDGGTTIGYIENSSSNFVIRSHVNDKDIIFTGTDNNTGITALTLDMSEAGAATFNNNVTAFSDERLKDNIETIENGLSKVEQLRGVTYTRDEKKNIGVIAQEVEKILPEVVLTADDEMGTKSVDYSRLTAVLIEAVKDLSGRVKELEGK
tara:strand:+ start:4319 stop:5443 length:1125 start_codon:yes stop_codon:yes gene_type:complete